jgi:hypothetical protein
MRSTFLYGDFLSYLSLTDRRFDLIFASGVLYEMKDPLDLLRLISLRTDRVFIWTFYVSDASASRTPAYSTAYVEDREFKYYRYDCQSPLSGEMTYSCRMSRGDILNALDAYGFDQIRIMNEGMTPDSESNFSLIAYRSR